MALHFSYNKENGILYARCTAEPLSLEELQQAVAVITQSRQYPASVPTLWDCRELDFKTFSEGFEDRLIALRSQHPERQHAQIAIVVSDDLAFGLSRKYEMMSSNLPQQLMICRTMEEAEAWLLRPRVA